MTNEKIAVHCKTEEEAKRLMEAYERRGLTWVSGGKPTEHTSFHVDDVENTCYEFMDKFGYGSIESFVVQGYKIIDVNEAISRLFPVTDECEYYGKSISDIKEEQKQAWNNVCNVALKIANYTKKPAKLELEDHTFSILRTNKWKLIQEDGLSVYVNPENDIWEYADGDLKGEQLFTWDAAMRETKKVGKRMPTDKEFQEIVKTKADVKNLKFSGYRDTDSSYYDHPYGDYLWASTQEYSSAAWYRYFNYLVDSVDRHYTIKAYGLTVRCVKEKEDVSETVVSPQKKPAKWVDTTPHVDNQMTLEDGSRKATINHNNGKFINCILQEDGETEAIIPSCASLEDWAFIEKVARKIRSLTPTK